VTGVQELQNGFNRRSSNRTRPRPRISLAPRRGARLFLSIVIIDRFQLRGPKTEDEGGQGRVGLRLCGPMASKEGIRSNGAPQLLAILLFLTPHKHC
jgi:hypothetical protein